MNQNFQQETYGTQYQNYNQNLKAVPHVGNLVRGDSYAYYIQKQQYQQETKEYRNYMENYFPKNDFDLNRSENGDNFHYECPANEEIIFQLKDYEDDLCSYTMNPRTINNIFSDEQEQKIISQQETIQEVPKMQEISKQQQIYKSAKTIETHEISSVSNKNVSTKSNSDDEEEFELETADQTEELNSDEEEFIPGKRNRKTKKCACKRKVCICKKGVQKSGKKICKRRGSASSRPAEDTKNLLRNFGGAQNKFCASHPHAIMMMNENYKHLQIVQREAKVREFKRWMPSKLENFKQFQEVWSRPGEFGELYREICFAFYEKFASDYIYQKSRLNDDLTRKTHQKYIYRFLEGILDPSKFYYFKGAKR